MDRPPGGPGELEEDGPSETEQNCTCEGAFCIERPQSFYQILEGSVRTSKMLRNIVWGVPGSCMTQIHGRDLGHHFSDGQLLLLFMSPSWASH